MHILQIVHVVIPWS